MLKAISYMWSDHLLMTLRTSFQKLIKPKMKDLVNRFNRLIFSLLSNRLMDNKLFRSHLTFTLLSWITFLTSGIFKSRCILSLRIYRSVVLSVILKLYTESIVWCLYLRRRRYPIIIFCITKPSFDHSVII